ncbi:MAG: hypothetical protein ACXWGV_12950 [Solirubrobacterales bacterium]
MTKAVERGIARSLRAEHGTPVKEIARLLSVSVASVSVWVRDIEITRDQRERNLTRAGQQRGEAWSERFRERRRQWQREGRERARLRDPMHIAGCMLYWAEGSKSRTSLKLTNSDPHMLGFFKRFLTESLGVSPDRLSISLNVYTDNGLTLTAIENHWLDRLELPRSALRGHTLNNMPTSSSGRKRTLPYGVCSLRATKSTRLVQHIYGAVQEYTGFDEPRWLDGLYG